MDQSTKLPKSILEIQPNVVIPSGDATKIIGTITRTMRSLSADYVNYKAILKICMR